MPAFDSFRFVSSLDFLPKSSKAVSPYCIYGLIDVSWTPPPLLQWSPRGGWRRALRLCLRGRRRWRGLRGLNESGGSTSARRTFTCLAFWVPEYFMGNVVIWKTHLCDLCWNSFLFSFLPCCIVLATCSWLVTAFGGIENMAFYSLEQPQGISGLILSFY